jgi:DNA repair exonuclease SbcCD ATPase subunit
MLSYIDWIIILIALIAMGIALLLFFLPASDNSAQTALRDLRLQAEKDRKRIADVLEVTQHGAKDAENLVHKLRSQVDDISHNHQTSQAKIEQAEHIIERVRAAEHEMRDISTQLGERLQHLQSYWDEQLGDSIESVQRIKSKLKEGLEHVDDSLFRLRDQEKMAQGFTRKLIEHHQEQVQNQQENSRLSAAVHTRLEDMLKESGHLLEQMQRYQQDADAVFNSFSQEMSGLESQASEHFTGVFQTTDQARTELLAGLDESRQLLSEMRLREAQSDDLTRRVIQQFEQIDHLRVERISKTLDLTDQISTDLHNGVTSARQMLATLERAVSDVSATLTDNPTPVATKPLHIASVEPLITAAPVHTDKSVSNIHNVTDDKALLDVLSDLTPVELTDSTEDMQRNLVSLRAYR